MPKRKSHSFFTRKKRHKIKQCDTPSGTTTTDCIVSAEDERPKGSKPVQFPCDADSFYHGTTTEAYSICAQNELPLEGSESAQYHCAKCEIITVYCETAENFIKLNQK